MSGGSSGAAGVDAGGGASGQAGSGGSEPTGGAAGVGGIGTGGAGQGGAAGAETGGSSTGGANTGGMNTGGMNTGGMNTGGMNTGGMNTGGMNTGGMNTGGMNTGGMNTGGMNTGGMNTGGMNTGGMNIGGSGTGGAVAETACLDKLDNDGDNSADCADSDCTGGYTCAGALPTGWMSIGYLNLTNPDAICPAGYPSKIVLNDPANLPGSQKCECACNNAGAICTSVATCGATCMSPTITQFPIEEFCTSFGTGNNTTCTLSPPVPTGGQCIMSFARPSFSWAATARFCQRDPNSGYGSCLNNNMVCVPKSAGDLGPCIVRSGEVACPAGPYTSRRVLSDGNYQDDRTCVNKDCTCGETIGGSCTGQQVYFYANGSCSSSQYMAINTDGECVSIAGQFSAAQVAGSLGESPTCEVSGAGITSGSIVPSKMTFCCML